LFAVFDGFGGGFVAFRKGCAATYARAFGKKPGLNGSDNVLEHNLIIYEETADLGD